jgi:hypothetical protein
VLIKGTLSSAIKNQLLETCRNTMDRAPEGRAIELRWDVDPESFG